MSGNTPEQILDVTINATHEARNLARMFYDIIIEIHGEKVLNSYLAGDKLPTWVTERPKRVRGE